MIYKKNNETILSHKTIGGIIDYYIIVDNSPENILKNINFLIGVPTLPPYWSLGNHQSRWGYKNFSEFKDVYENYKLKKIPIDVMWLDIESMDKYEIFTLNENRFKSLPEYINNRIHKDYGYFVPIIDIGIIYNESNLNKYIQIGDENNLFIKSGYTKKNLMSKIWPGKTVYPDFFNPEIYKLWNKGLDDYYNIIKYDGIWLDRNEPSNFKAKKCPGELFDNKEDENKCNMINDFKISYLPGYIDNLDTLTNRTINMNGITYNNNIL